MCQELAPQRSNGMKLSSEYQTGNIWPGRDFLSLLAHAWLLSDKQHFFYPFSSENSSLMLFPSEESIAQGVLFHHLSPLECLGVGGDSLGITFFSWRAIKLQEIYFRVVCEWEWLNKIQNVPLIYCKNNLRYASVLHHFMLLLLKVGGQSRKEGEEEAKEERGEKEEVEKWKGRG